uniref:Secreted protein n=1 Tax=Glossina morsitans morsitans TaxID=37546 RepID=A0A1B0G8F3_GLOMM
MNSYVVIVVILTILIVVNAAENGNVKTEEHLSSGQQPFSGNVAVDEVVVESSLYIKPKPRLQFKRTRRSVWEKPINYISLLEHKRTKRGINDH